MIDEPQRRAWLSAMQVDVWLPRQTLPFAAPSRPELLVLPAPVPVRPAAAPRRPVSATVPPPKRPLSAVSTAPPAQQAAALKAALQAPPSATAETQRAAAPVAPVESQDTPPVTPAPAAALIPRFSLQLLRAGACLLLVSLPTGEAFARRDPGYLLLRDLLRAAGLPDSPQPLGEPIRWPMLRGRVSHFDQGVEAAQRYVCTVLQAQQEATLTRGLWLIGAAARQFAGAPQVADGQSVRLDGLGTAWALPDLESLLERPALKGELWHHMRRERHRWIFPDE
ncbi:protein TonB [Pseudomonas sp. NW5]|uniref:protein TonB n=1 Tax=Pseudomonas sp. NW5 TaxID=2934934 RepID=UPI002020FC0B|nr:protein TonB [Pseudomonas sp. NW5]